MVLGAHGIDTPLVFSPPCAGMAILKDFRVFFVQTLGIRRFGCFSCHVRKGGFERIHYHVEDCVFFFTPMKTNMSPEKNDWKTFSLLRWSLLRGHVSFRGCILCLVQNRIEMKQAVFVREPTA